MSLKDSFTAARCSAILTSQEHSPNETCRCGPVVKLWDQPVALKSLKMHSATIVRKAAHKDCERFDIEFTTFDGRSLHN
eukprot:4038438-Amphidinium_carterae.1